MKNKLLMVLISFAVIAFLQVYFLPGYSFRIDVLSDIVTFLSITFGFYITSLAIFTTSQYVSNLYKIVDAKNRSQTLLNTLTDNYNAGLIFSLLSLLYFIGIQFFIDVPPSGTVFLGDIKLSLVFAFLVVNFGYCFFMLRDLIRIIIQEAKSRSEITRVS